MNGAATVGRIPVAIMGSSVRHWQANGFLDEYQFVLVDGDAIHGRRPHRYDLAAQRITVPDTATAAMI